MSTDEILGAAGVFLLLLAFLLNLRGRLGHADRRYHVMNALGAGLACFASWRIGYWPFVVLEGAWTLVALVALLRPRATPSG